MPQIDRQWLGGYVRKGTFIIRRSVGGKRYEISTRCTTEKAALKVLEAFEVDPTSFSLSDNVNKASPKRPLYLTQELAQEFLDAMREKGNCKLWRLQQARFITWWHVKLGSKDLRSITSVDVKMSLQKATSYKHRLAVIKAFFRWMREHKDAHVSTLEDIPSPQTKPAQWKKSRVVSEDNIRTVLEILKAPYNLALMVQVGTGWHVQEVMRFAKDGALSRHLPIPLEGAVITSPLHKDGSPVRTEVSEVVAHAAALLRQHGKLSYHPYYKALGKACERLNIVPAITPGSFRHTAATWAINKGATPEQVAAWLQHKDKRTTMRFYATHAIVPKVPTLR